jgi:hypothetical protein
MLCKSVPAIVMACCLLTACCAVQAQYYDDYDAPLLLRPKGLGISAGSQGLGIDYTQGIQPGFSARLGVSYLPFSYNYSGVFGSVDSDIKLKTKSFINAHLFLDWYPLEGYGLRITPGAGYFFDAKANANVKSTGSYKYGDIVVTGDDVGTMEGEIKWKGIAPYLGAGWLFGFSEGESPLTLGIDLGTYYLPKPDATLTGTKLLEDNQYNEEKFKENVKNYRWLPLLQVSLRYNL